MEQKRKIAIVDDDPDIRSILSYFLRKHNFITIEAEDGKKAIEAIIKEKPDIAIIDWLLPKVDGLGVIKELLSREPQLHTKFIMITAVYRSKDIEDQIVNYKIDAFITKPFQLDYILKVINRILGSDVKKNEEEKQTKTSTSSKTQKAPNYNYLKELIKKPLPLMGDLSEYIPPLIFQKIWYEAKTCIITFYTNQDKKCIKRIFTIEGSPVYVQSWIKGETLGSFLLRNDLITIDQHTEIIEEMKNTNKKYSEIAIMKGYLAPHTIYDYMYKNMEERLINTFKWDKGISYNISLEDSFTQNILIFKINPSRIIIDGVKRYYNESRIKSLIEIEEDSIPYLVTTPPTYKEQLKLTTQESRIYEYLKKGNYSIGELMEKLYMPKESLIQLLFSFFIMGLIDIKSKDKEAPLIKGGSSLKEEQIYTLTEPKEQLTQTAVIELDQIVTEYFKLKQADYFSLLGVSQDASISEIIEAYKEKSQKFHPDKVKHKGLPKEKAEELYKKIVQAYKTLIDPQLKKEYIAKLKSERSSTPELTIQQATSNEEIFIEAQKEIEKGNYKKAFEKLERLLKEEKGNPKYEAYYGWVLYSLDKEKNRKKAEKHLELARRSDPSSPYPYWFMARILAEEGNDEKAYSLYKKACELDVANEELQREFHEYINKLNKLGRKIKKILFKKIG